MEHKWTKNTDGGLPFSSKKSTISGKVKRIGSNGQGLKHSTLEYTPRIDHRFRLRSVSQFERQCEKQIQELEELEEFEIEELRKKRILQKSITNKEKVISHFSQQNLVSTFPTITVTKVYRRIAFYSFFLYVVSFMTYIANESVNDKIVEYTDCNDYRNNRPCDNHTDLSPCICKIHFNITEAIPRDVYVYYIIEGMYQNHMAYSESRDYVQLFASTEDKLRGDHDQCGNLTEDIYREMPYVPCGQLLNSMFNDTFVLYYYHPNITSKLIQLPLNRKNLRFKPKRMSRNPESEACKYSENPLKCAFRNGVPPPSWRNEIWNLSMDDSNNGYLNDDLMNWITISTTNNVKKLWATVIHDYNEHFINGLPQGRYVLIAENNYPISNFGGRKKIYLSNSSWFGGKNLFFPKIAFILAILSTACAVYCFYLHIHYGKMIKRMHDYLMISERRDRRIRTAYILTHSCKLKISKDDNIVDKVVVNNKKKSKI